MKLTLHDPPEGFEAEAELRLPKYGDKFIGSGGYVRLSECNFEEEQYIVLTPKKRKYWRLDPVATFEEATPYNEDSPLRYAYVKGAVGLAEDHHKTSTWLRLTECEEIDEHRREETRNH